MFKHHRLELHYSPMTSSVAFRSILTDISVHRYFGVLVLLNSWYQIHLKPKPRNFKICSKIFFMSCFARFA